jgi:hypothetical protein
MARRKRPDTGTIIYPPISTEQLRIARERTDFIPLHPEMALRDMLANAYVCGLIDAAEVIAMKEASDG